MRPHVDLSKTYVDVHKNVHCTTFTFLLHLRDSGVLDGGETVLLEKLSGSDGKKKNILADPIINFALVRHRQLKDPRSTDN